MTNKEKIETYSCDAHVSKGASQIEMSPQSNLKSFQKTLLQVFFVPWLAGPQHSQQLRL